MSAHALRRTLLPAARHPQLLQRVQRRALNLHEYQSKEQMLKYNVAVQKFRTADTAEQAEQYARELSACGGC